MRWHRARDYLEVGTLGAVGLSLPHLMAAQAQGAVKDRHDDRSVIMIFNLGAPAVDTFDPKPNAAAEIRGPFQPISTKSPDIQITEILPRHAQHADKFSLVRSCYHTGAAVHDTGHQMMQTGRLLTEQFAVDPVHFHPGRHQYLATDDDVHPAR